MNQRRAAVFLPLFLIFVVFFSRLVGCSTQADETGLLANDGGPITNPAVLACASPAQGCSCGDPGATSSCGRVEVTVDGFKQCSYGTLTCTGAGTWSACEGTVHVQSLLATPGERFHAQVEQLDASECGDGDPCDPYCNGYTDTPSGVSPLPSGFSLVDGGLTVVATSDGGDIPGTLQTTGNGNSTCGSALNVGGGGCTGTDINDCQQDFRCDLSSHTCLWNGGEGYHNTTLGGADLTIGTGCSYGTDTSFPVCNRGSTTIAAGTPLNVYYVPGATAPTGCATPSVPVTCSEPAPTDGLQPGTCVNVPCTIGTGGGYAVVNAGDATHLEASGWCANNVAFAQTSNGVPPAGDGGSDAAVAAPTCAVCTSCSTALTGAVYDPGLNVPLPDVTVYQAARTDGTINTLTDNPASSDPPCDTCDTLLPSSVYSTATNTAIDGSFTLYDVAPGPHQTIVAQTGRWRRKLTMDIPACQTTPIPPESIRLPRKKSEGDIPKIGLVMGSAESLECWLLTVGIDPSEMSPYTGPGDTQRVQLFQEADIAHGEGMGFSGTPLLNADGNLWSSSGVINEYAALILSCDGTDFPGLGGDAMSAMANYADKGGRVFMDHYYGQTFLTENGSPWNTDAVSTWVQYSGQPYFGEEPDAVPAYGKVENTSTAQQHMLDWINAYAADPVPGLGYVVSSNPRYNSLKAGGDSVTWIRGDNDNFAGHSGHGGGGAHPDGDYTLSFSFETPAGATSTCGRVLFNGMHASQSRSPLLEGGGHGGALTCRAPGPFDTGDVVCGTFPQDCDTTTGLTSEELALEYQLFQVTACALGGRPPPAPPPPPPALATETFTRDFYGQCGDGYQLVWQSFNWEASIPPGTAIQFYAATSNDEATLPASVSAAPVTVPVGSARLTTLAPQWGTDDHTVDWHLQNEPPGPPQQSEPWLRVYMVFEPTGAASPTMYDWQQLYDCVPNQ